MTRKITKLFEKEYGREQLKVVDEFFTNALSADYSLLTAVNEIVDNACDANLNKEVRMDIVPNFNED